MQDTAIVPNYWAYSYRYDIPDVHVVKHLAIIYDKIKRDFLDLIRRCPFIEFYLGALEVGKYTKKPHIQAIVWAQDKLSIKNMQHVRNRTRALYGYDKNDGKVAFSSARKISSLASYVTKEQQGELITNLSTVSLGRLDEWVDSSSFSKNKVECLERKIKEFVISGMSFPRFCILFSDSYLAIYKTPCIRRATYFKYALLHGIISTDLFLEKISVLERSNNNTCNYCADHCENFKI